MDCFNHVLIYNQCNICSYLFSLEVRKKQVESCNYFASTRLLAQISFVVQPDFAFTCTGCLNPRFSSINTCNCHVTSNSIHEPTNAFNVFASSTSTPQRLLHPNYRRASSIGIACLQNQCPQGFYTWRGPIRFLRAFYTTARSLLQVHHDDSSTSLSGARWPLLSTTRHRPNWTTSFQLHRRQRRGRIIHSLLSNHVFHIEYDNLRRHDYARSVARFNLHYYDRSI
jgi:hypothetical protein